MEFASAPLDVEMNAQSDAIKAVDGHNLGVLCHPLLGDAVPTVSMPTLDQVLAPQLTRCRPCVGSSPLGCRLFLSIESNGRKRTDQCAENDPIRSHFLATSITT